MDNTRHYFAFISYSSHDQAWGKRLQRKLEGYRMPATLCSERGWERKPINPVFFAPTDIQPGGLTAELQERLRASRHLIVICSPHSAQSEWVGKEIEYFHSLGRTANIHFFIVDGKPHSGDPETECFNPVVERLGLPEILGANIHEPIYRWSWLNKERAYVQLISKLLGVEFDSIWQRHRRRMVQRAVAWTLGGIAIAVALAFTWHANQQFDSEIRLAEASPRNAALPPMADAVVTITLDNETKSDTLRTMKTSVVFANLPHRYLKESVHIQVTCYGFLETDTVMPLSKAVELPIRRDPEVYGAFRFKLWNPMTEKSYPQVAVTVEGHQFVADDSGYVYVRLPLEAQREKYHITASTPKVDDTLTVPCGPDAVITTNE
jgi:hypothetical protein